MTPNCARPIVVIAALAIVNSSRPHANRSISVPPSTITQHHEQASAASQEREGPDDQPQRTPAVEQSRAEEGQEEREGRGNGDESPALCRSRRMFPRAADEDVRRRCAVADRALLPRPSEVCAADW